MEAMMKDPRDMDFSEFQREYEAGNIKASAAQVERAEAVSDKSAWLAAQMINTISKCAVADPEIGKDSLIPLAAMIRLLGQTAAVLAKKDNAAWFKLCETITGGLEACYHDYLRTHDKA
jgi:hypothetical protein